MSSLWLKIQHRLEEQFSDRTPFLSFLKAVSLKQGSQKTQFVLDVPSKLHKEKAQIQLIPLLTQEIHKLIGQQPSQIQIHVNPSKKTYQKPLISQIAKKEEIKPSSHQALFNPLYTFENFVSGPSNEHAFYAIKNVISHPLFNPNNPLFIYGQTGLGKTHLLHALGRALCKQFSRLYYLSAERFLQECVTSIRTQQMDFFKKKYQQECQILLVDDIQAIEKGVASQEEFFHTFNAITERGGLVVCTCDRLPREIKNMQTRLQTRLAGGVIFEIEPPKIETRIAILQSKAKQKGMHLSEDVLFYIAQNSLHSVRELEGYLNKIKMVCDLQKQRPSLSFVKTILSSKESLSVEELLEQVAKEYHVSVQQLRSKSKTKGLVAVRKIAVRQIREKFPHLSLGAIGQFLGGRNHSTILNALHSQKIK